ncbi:MAG: hypothetical protein WAU00_08045 [Caldilinea sp.]
MQNNDATMRWQRRRFCLLALLAPLLLLSLGGILLSSTPAHSTPAHDLPTTPPPPAPMLHPIKPAVVQDIEDGQNAEDEQGPVRAYLKVGLLADKPDEMPLQEYCPSDDEVEAAAGEMLAFCYQFSNDSEITFTHHTIVDSIFGIVLENEPFELKPNEGVGTFKTIAASATRTNVMTWTAYAENGDSASAFASATVIVPTLVTTATVGQTPGECADASRLDLLSAAAVEFCFRAYNPTPYDLIAHRAIDTAGNELTLPDDLTLAPGETFTITTSALVTEPVAYGVLWSAQTDTRRLPVTSTATATVRTPHLQVILTFAKNSGGCRYQSLTVTPGTQVVYCYSALNDGSATFQAHRFTDEPFASDFSLPTPNPLLPDKTIMVLITRPVTTTTTSYVTWYATLENGDIVSNTTQGDVFVVPPATIEVNARFDPEDGKPQIGVSDVAIRLIDAEGDSQTRTTGDDGIARFDDLIPGVYTLSVVTSSLDSKLHLVSPVTLTTSVSARATISLTYVLTGVLPIKPLYIPFVSR